MKNKKLLILTFSILILLVALTVGYLVFFDSSNSTNGPRSPLQVNTPRESINEKAVKDSISSKSFQEAKEENPEDVTSPYISDAELRDEVYEEVITNENPQNFRVAFDGSSVDPLEIFLIQGDFVSFENNSDQTIDVVGEDNWSATQIEPGAFLTIGFDFKGNYNYSVISTETGEELTTGIVSVGSVLD